MQPSGGPEHWVLGPATRVLWRGADSVCLGLGEREVVLTGVDGALVGTLAGRDTVAAPEGRVLDATSHAVLRDLHDAGFLWRRGDPDTGATPAPVMDHRRVPPHPRLAGELRSLAARHGERAAELLDARHHACVVVSGSGRAATPIATLLAGSGVGRVHVAAPGTTRLHHAVPGGVSPGDEGRTLAAAAESAVLRAAPETDTAAPGGSERPDLVVLACDEPVDEVRRSALHADEVAHLPVATGPGHGSVGPLVLPGLTGCLRCADLHRRDRDPAWPALAAQLTVPRHAAAGDAGVTALLAAAAVLQVLTFLDGGEPTCIEGSLEVCLPDWRIRRRGRPPHVDCGCLGAPGPEAPCGMSLR